MKKHYSLLVLSTALALPIFLNSTPKAAAAEKKVPVQFLSVNDLHGYIEGSNEKAENGKAIGGMDSLAYHFQEDQASFATKNKLKSTTSNSVLVQVGDIVGGSPAISGLLQDEPTMNIMNTIGFNVGTLGNHEFDEGIEEFTRILNGEVPTYKTNNYGNVFNYSQSKSKTSIVIANVYNKKTNKRIAGYKPYTIKKVNGIKIGYIGVVTPEIKYVVAEEHMKNIKITEPDKEIAKYTKELRKQGVKAIVLLAHSGANMNAKANQSIDQQKSNVVEGDIVNTLKKVNTLDPKNSIDIVFAAHTHQFANGVYKKIRIVQALSYSNAYGMVTGTLSSKTKDFISTPSAEVKYNYTVKEATIMKNKVAKKVNTQIKEANSLIANTVNSTIATMDKERLNSVPEVDGFGSELGNLITDAQLNMANDKGYETDFAFTNTGGIRTDLVGSKSGNSYNITYGAAQAVQPFNNFLQHVQMTGSQVKKVLNEQFNNGQKKLDVAGLHYTYNDKGVVDVFIGQSNERIVANKTYKVVINNYLSGGKDNYAIFKKATDLKTIDMDTDIFISYLEKIKNYSGDYTSRAIFVNN